MLRASSEHIHRHCLFDGTLGETLCTAVTGQSDSKSRAEQDWVRPLFPPLVLMVINVGILSQLW